MTAYPQKSQAGLGQRHHKRDSTAAIAPVGDDAPLETRPIAHRPNVGIGFLRPLASTGRIRRVGKNRYLVDDIGLETTEDLWVGPSPTCER